MNIISLWLFTGRVPILSPHMGRFNRIFQVAPMCTPYNTDGSLNPPDLSSENGSRSVQPFLCSSRHRVPILYSGPPFSPENCPFMWGSKPHRSPHPKWHLERFSRFTGLTIVTDRQTDRQTDDDRSSVTIGRIYVRSTAMRRSNNKTKSTEN